MGSSCTTLNPGKVIKPIKTPGEHQNQIDTLAIEEKRSSAISNASIKYKKTLDEVSTYVAGSIPLNSRTNMMSMDCHEENVRFPSLHFLTEENCEEVSANLEESQTKKSAHFNKGPLIGRGSCGDVYECLNLKTGELVAVKEIRLRGELNEIQKYTNALRKENVLFKTLNHPNIIRHYDTEIVEIKDMNHILINISVEYVSGGSILTLLKKFKKLDEKVVMIYLRQILDGLYHLHKMDIVHTNLKGTNILIDASGTVKLSDFGSLKLDRFSGENPHDASKITDATKSSVYWLAPEVIATNKYTKAADIWSAGCVVVEMLTGNPPWESFVGSFQETIDLINSGNLPPLPAETSDICRDFLQKTFQLNPEDRPSVDDLLDHPFVRDVTPSNSYFESDTLPSGLSGKAGDFLRCNSSHERHVGPRINELRVPYLDINSNRGHLHRNRMARRGYSTDYIQKSGYIKSPSSSDKMPISETGMEERASDPIVLKVPDLVKVKEVPPDDEFTPDTSQKQFFSSRPRHLLGKVSRDMGDQDRQEKQEMSEEEIERIKMEKRRQFEEEMMREAAQESSDRTHLNQTNQIAENGEDERLNAQVDGLEQSKEVQSEIINERLDTIPDESVLTTEKSILDCQRMDISEEQEPMKEGEGSATDEKKALEDEIEKRFAEIRSNNSRTFWAWERENDNDKENDADEDDNGRQGSRESGVQSDNNPVSIIEYKDVKPKEVKQLAIQLAIHPKVEKRLIMQNAEMIKITKKKGSEGKTDRESEGLTSVSDVVEIGDYDRGVHRQLSVRYSGELYQTITSPQAFEYLERKLNTIGEMEEKEENKEASRDYGKQEAKDLNVYLI